MSGSITLYESDANLQEYNEFLVRWTHRKYAVTLLRLIRKQNMAWIWRDKSGSVTVKTSITIILFFLCTTLFQSSWLMATYLTQQQTKMQQQCALYGKGTNEGCGTNTNTNLNMTTRDMTFWGNGAIRPCKLYRKRKKTFCNTTKQKYHIQPSEM